MLIGACCFATGAVFADGARGGAIGAWGGESGGVVSVSLTREGLRAGFRAALVDATERVERRVWIFRTETIGAQKTYGSG